MSTCIGYGEFEGKCENAAGTPWTPLWCLRCDKIRRATIGNQLEGILDSLDQEKTP
jgi:hypothetical protein